MVAMWGKVHEGVKVPRHGNTQIQAQILAHFTPIS